MRNLFLSIAFILIVCFPSLHSIALKRESFLRLHKKYIWRGGSRSSFDSMFSNAENALRGTKKGTTAFAISGFDAFTHSNSSIVGYFDDNLRFDCSRVVNFSNHDVMLCVGLAFDMRYLVKECQEKIIDYKFDYGSLLPLSRIASYIASFLHSRTLTSNRILCLRCILTGTSKQSSALWEIDNVGNCKPQAMACIGKNEELWNQHWNSLMQQDCNFRHDDIWNKFRKVVNSLRLVQSSSLGGEIGYLSVTNGWQSIPVSNLMDPNFNLSNITTFMRQPH